MGKDLLAIEREMGQFQIIQAVIDGASRHNLQMQSCHDIELG